MVILAKWTLDPQCETTKEGCIQISLEERKKREHINPIKGISCFVTEKNGMMIFFLK